MNEKETQEAALQERLVHKYTFIREKIFENFKKGCRILRISKMTAAVLFVLFTLIGIAISHRTGHELLWLQAWILVIFLNIFIFVPADYARYLIESKVIPYLKNDDQVEFGEYDIFKEDLDDVDEDEDEEEETEED